MAGQTTNSFSPRVAALVTGASALLSASLSVATRTQYQRVWNRFNQFIRETQLQPALPASVAAIALYITHLTSPPCPSSPATIATNISAIAYFHKMAGAQDPTSHFLIRKILKGTTKLYPTCDLRIPISPTVLHALVASTQHIAFSPYETAMCGAMYALMFHAFLRLGEVTASPHNIAVHQVAVTSTSIALTFTSYKHSQGHPITLYIPASSSPTCAVTLLSAYIKVRGLHPGPLFCYPGHIPVSPARFRLLLAMSLARCGMAKVKITPHSFRIGAATFAATKGHTTSQIQAMGRWKSDAFKQYIRIQAITL